MFFDRFFGHQDEAKAKEEAAQLKKEEAEITRNYREETKLEPPEPQQRSKRYHDEPQRWQVDERDLRRSGRLDEEEDHYVERGLRIMNRRNKFFTSSRKAFLGGIDELEEAA